MAKSKQPVWVGKLRRQLKLDKFRTTQDAKDDYQGSQMHLKES